MVCQSHGRLRSNDLQQHDAEGVDVGLDTEHASLLVLRVNVAEGASSGGHAILGDGVGHGWGDETGKADVTDLAAIVAIEEYICGLEVSMDQWLRLCLVEEEEPCAYLGSYAEPLLPWDRGCVPTSH